MENNTIEELQSLIEEDIYLIPKDREAILAQLPIESPTPTQAKPAEATNPTEEPKNTAPSMAAEQSPQPTHTTVEEITPEPIPVRGNFSKGVLILHEEEELSAEVMEMLVKMIKACGHSMSEVGMLASSGLENRTMEDFQNLNAHTILKFGRIKHSINAISAPRYEVYSENETEYLFADSLSEIAEDKTLKVKLWTSLQVLFNLSPKK